MDPLSLAATILALADTALRATIAIRKYYAEVKHAQEARNDMLAELQALRGVLCSVGNFLKADALKKENLTFSDTSVLVSCSTAIKVKLEDLEKVLTKDLLSDKSVTVDASRKRLFKGELLINVRARLSWPLNKQERSDLLKDIRSFSLWLHIALSAEGCKLLSKNANDVSTILAEQSKQIQVLQDLDLRSTHIDAAVTRISTIVHDEQQARILEWLSTLDYEDKHRDVDRRRTVGTGRWLFYEPDFLVWRRDVSAHNVLCLEGGPGVGKTYLVNAAIDELTQPNMRETSPVCFYYFEYFKSPETQTPVNVLKALLRQLLQHLSQFPTSAIAFYDRANRSAKHLKLEDYEALISEISSRFSMVYLVFDALDECNGTDNGKGSSKEVLLAVIERLTKSQHIRILMTSRLQDQEIAKVFAQCHRIQVEAHTNDLELYARERIDAKVADGIVDDAFAQELKTVLIRRASGMFLLLRTELDLVLAREVQGGMKRVVRSLVAGTVAEALEDAFDRTLNRIQSQDSVDLARWGMQSLMWITYAERPLTMEELTDVLAVEQGQAAISVEDRPKPQMVLTSCKGFVKLDEGTGCVSLAHKKIQEHLSKYGHRLFPQAESKVARTCLTYLSSADFGEGPFKERMLIMVRARQFPFSSYASRYWGKHVQEAQDDEKVQLMTNHFLNNVSNLAAASQLMQFQKGLRDRYYNSEECYSITPLHHACRYGLLQVLQNLLLSPGLDVNQATSVTQSPPMVIAAGENHYTMVEALLKYGADPYKENWYGNALHCAVEAGGLETIRLLVEGHGMSPNACDRYERPPIFCALDRDHHLAVELLNDLGADLDARESFGSRLPLLHRAAMENAWKTLDVILRRRPDLIDSTCARGTTAMHWATYTRAKNAVRILVARGANLDLEDHHGETAEEVAHKVEDVVIPRGNRKGNWN